MNPKSVACRLVLGLALLSAAGCATTEKREAFLQEFNSRGVTGELYDKVESNRRLELTDIEELVRKQVPDGAILSHVRRTRTVYELKTAQVDQLREAGASDALLDGLLTAYRRGGPYDSPGGYYHYYPRPYPYSYYGWGYYHRPYYYHHYHGHHRSHGIRKYP